MEKKITLWIIYLIKHNKVKTYSSHVVSGRSWTSVTVKWFVTDDPTESPRPSGLRHFSSALMFVFWLDGLEKTMTLTWVEPRTVWFRPHPSISLWYLLGCTWIFVCSFLSFIDFKMQSCQEQRNKAPPSPSWPSPWHVCPHVFRFRLCCSHLRGVIRNKSIFSCLQTYRLNFFQTKRTTLNAGVWWLSDSSLVKKKKGEVEWRN